MKKYYVRIVAVLLVGSLVLSSCAAKKKYGCPNHISITNLLKF